MDDDILEKAFVNPFGKNSPFRSSDDNDHKKDTVNDELVEDTSEISEESSFDTEPEKETKVEKSEPTSSDSETMPNKSFIELFFLNLLNGLPIR